ncbi:MAG TPA: RDD family protein [Candidatus Cybelea sp.]|nr:RDD family protein [Candidatus Cybelea sp.]
MHNLFEGRSSLAEPSERFAFWATALCAFPAALLIGYALHESIGASQVALFIVIAMVYVTLARGRLLGSSVRVHERQYPRVFEIVKRACAALEIPMPFVFVREDNNVPAVALGFGEPYALVLSSHWIELFADDELAFMIGRELGHIAAGHTRFHSLLSVNGNENPLVSLIFGAWLRRCALTCDKVGLLCCGSVDAAIRAMGIAAFHAFGRKVDYEAFAQQHAEVQSDSVLRWGEWLSSEPYATRRIESLRVFTASQKYATAEAWFLRERSEEPPTLAAPGTTTVATRDCAGWWRRFAAWGIDAVVVSAIITSFGGSVVGHPGDRSVTVGPGDNVTISEPTTRPGTAARSRRNYRWRNPLAPAQSGNAPATSAPSPSPADGAALGPVVLNDSGVGVKLGGNTEPISIDSITEFISAFVRRLGFFFWFPVYLAVLVIIAGQTFGMMIAGLRVVTTDFHKPSIARTIFRYLIVFAVWWLIVPFSLVWRRVLLHDRWTKTRVVKVERVVARLTGA